MPRPRSIPGKERGVHAGWDADGDELVYIGLDAMVMSRSAMERMDRIWDEVFSK
jgi:hypothetical protein